MDILDIDTVLEDDSLWYFQWKSRNINDDNLISFSLLEENQDDIDLILQQWKINREFQQDKKLDTRTFTRPRRKLEHSNNKITSRVDMKIGGLVTNLQRSFLNETSPPSSICSSIDFSVDRINNSLVTSADFSSINFLKTSENELHTYKPNETCLNELIKMRNPFESLSITSESSNKDFNSHTDDIHFLGEINSTCSTVKNSVDSICNGFNETFKSQKKTLISRNKDNFKHQEDEENTPLNTTFNFIGDFNCNEKLSDSHATTIVSEETYTDNKDTTYEVQKSINCNQTFDSSETSNYMNKTENIKLANTSLSEKIYLDNKTINFAPKQSTPQRKSLLVLSSNKNSHPIDPLIEEVNISPIVPVKEERAIKNDSKIHLDLKTAEDKQNYLHYTINKTVSRKVLQPKFLEEETFNVSILSKSENEKELDEILNSITSRSDKNVQTNKLRQSLNNIKKRHSLVVLEKTQQGEKKTTEDRRETTKELLSRSTERLLNRRSRLYEDFSDSFHSDPVQKNENQNLIEQGHINLTAKNEQKTENDKQNKLRKMEERNLDRFRTMRISNSFTNNQNAPHKENNDKKLFSIGSKVTGIIELNNNKNLQKIINIDHQFKHSNIDKPSKKQSNSEVFSQQKSNQNEKTDSVLHLNVLSKANSGNDIGKEINSVKSRHSNKQSTQKKVPSFNFSKRNYNFNSKADSHSPLLLTADTRSISERKSNISKNCGRSLSLNRVAIFSVEEKKQNLLDIFKAPNQLGRVPASRKTGIIRPSSGFFTYSGTKLDSGSESGRFSPSNSVSSVSSSGSIYESRLKSLNRNTNERFTTINKDKYSIIPPKKTGEKATGIKPLSSTRKSCLPRLSNVVRR